MTAACTDEGRSPAATEPTPGPAAELARLDCTVTVADGRMACQNAAPSLGDARGLVVGGQGNHVYLQASNNTYSAGTEIYSIDVTVQNLLFQALGTTDGTTLDPGGVKVLFDVEPYATGGSVGQELELAGGVQRATLMRADQAYYPYDEVLQPSQTSAPVTWQISKPAGVTSFRFIVYVMAQVPFPDGRIDLSPTVDTLLEGATQALTPSVINPLGNPIAGQTVAWGTSDPAVATVDASGVVTAVSAGAATITAASGPRSGTADIVVCPDLSVGEAYTLTMPAAANLCLGGGGAGAEYTYMPVNLSTSSSLSLAVTASGITAAAGPPSPALLPSGTQARVLGAPMVDDGGFHIRQMERDFRELAPLARRPESRVAPGRTQRRAPGGPSMAITPGTPTVGDLWSLNTASGCAGTPDFRTGRVVSIGQHVIIVADTANPAGGFTTAQYDSIGLEFDSLAYPVNTANFGEPTDLDDNDRVVAFYTRAVNELSPPASSAVVAGYVAPRDLFAADASCPRSNVGEIFYMLVPDPTGAVNSNVRTVSFVRGGTVGTLAHEFQHLINTSRRLYVHNATSLEEVWLNEGLSHIAEELMFYRTSVGLAPRGNIVLSTLTTGPNASRRVAAFNTYANQNYGRLRSWLQRPDTTGAFKTNDGLATRGATWAFLRYAADRRNGTDAQLWYDLVNTQATGKANLQAVLGVDPDTWLRDFTSAMYADDAVTGIGPEQRVTSWNFRSLYGGLNGSYQLVPRALTNGVALTLSYSRGGGTGYLRFGVPTGAFASVTALSGGLAPTSPYALIVVRTK
ncbi:MAG TPA: Ig-like domain-containing protein [Longimicrobium sp.]|nr:Ig-like domain-containing protein [Longimicrobium sp.]